MSYVNYSWKVFTDDNSGTDFDLNGLPDKHTSYKIMAQKKQGHRPAKNPRSRLLLTEELLQ
jgi:hypothetical protein